MKKFSVKYNMFGKFQGFIIFFFLSFYFTSLTSYYFALQIYPFNWYKKKIKQCRRKHFSTDLNNFKRRLFKRILQRRCIDFYRFFVNYRQHLSGGRDNICRPFIFIYSQLAYCYVPLNRKIVQLLKTNDTSYSITTKL